MTRWTDDAIAFILSHADTHSDPEIAELLTLATFSPVTAASVQDVRQAHGGRKRHGRPPGKKGAGGPPGRGR